MNIDAITGEKDSFEKRYDAAVAKVKATADELTAHVSRPYSRQFERATVAVNDYADFIVALEEAKKRIAKARQDDAE